jgi:hypothetical protein
MLIIVASVVVLQIGLNAVLYGGVAQSGYGGPGELFQVGRLSAGLINVVKWTTVTHTFLLWPAWAGSMWVLRDRRQPLFLSLVAVAAAAPYFFYLRYDDWESTRFIVGSVVLILAVIAEGLYVVANRKLAPALRLPACAMLVMICAMGSSRFLHSGYLFDLWHGEQKYPLVGEWFRANTPPRAVILSLLHSGSIRYYGHRDTVRWDLVPEDSLAATVNSLAAHDRPVFLALDIPGEADPFNRRFGVELQRVLQLPAGGVREVTFYELKVREH